MAVAQLSTNTEALEALGRLYWGAPPLEPDMLSAVVRGLVAEHALLTAYVSEQAREIERLRALVLPLEGRG
jgi:hypothetical protein